MRDREKRSTKFARHLRRNLSRAETILWQHLRKRQLQGLRFRRQFPIANYITDFACPEIKLIIEVDGETHSSASEMAHDKARTEFLESEGWQVLRYWNKDIYDNLEGVLDAIAEAARDIELGRTS